MRARTCCSIARSKKSGHVANEKEIVGEGQIRGAEHVDQETLGAKRAKQTRRDDGVDNATSFPATVQGDKRGKIRRDCYTIGAADANKKQAVARHGGIDEQRMRRNAHAGRQRLSSLAGIFPDEHAILWRRRGALGR